MSRGSKVRRSRGASRSAPPDWTNACCGDCIWPDDEDGEPQPRCGSTDGGLDPERMARAYALDGEASAEFPDGTKWAFGCVFSMAFDHPQHCLEIIRRAALAATTAWQRTMIGCGNLETLLGNHGASLIDDVERLARESPQFRECLANVWQHGMPDDVWARVLKASGRA